MIPDPREPRVHRARPPDRRPETRPFLVHALARRSGHRLTGLISHRAYPGNIPHPTDFPVERASGDSQYDPGWPGTFTELRGKVAGTLGPLAPRRIERVGSTAVPGLPAKSVTDIDVVRGRKGGEGADVYGPAAC